MLRDTRYAIRLMLRRPVFAVSAILTLAFCIGANTAIYTVVDLLLRPLPYPEPDRLVEVVTQFWRGDIGFGQTGGTWEVLRHGVAALDLATTSGGFGSTGVNLVVGDHPEYVRQQRVSAGYFHVLGVAPALGREFTADEDRPGGPAAAVLSHGLWLRLFNRDPSAIGRSITLRGEPHTIVGVMPERFTIGSPVDVWTPVRPCRTCEGGGQNYEIIGRLEPGVTWAQAESEIAAVAQPVMDDLYRTARHPAREHIIPLQRGETERVRQPILILWGAVAAVLLIGCVNVAGLLIARGAERAPEFAMRLALGGGRAAIVRQLLIESVVLALCGGALGIGIGYVGSRAFGSLLGDAFGVTAQLTLDGRILAITAATALATSVAFGLLPAVQSARVNLRETLVASGSGSIAGAARTWPRRAMVVVEVAMGVVLLVGAGLLIRTLDHLLRLQAGFDGTHVMTATLSLDDARYRTAARVNQLFERTLDRMRALPGVESAAVALTLPYERALNVGWAFVGAERQQRAINMTYVTPHYFETLRIPLLRGRAFAPTDAAPAPAVIIVNHAFVRQYSTDVNPLGRQIATGDVVRTVVGIAGDIQQKGGLGGGYGPVDAMPAAYIPASQAGDGLVAIVHTWFSPSWFVRTSGARDTVAPDMQRAVQSIDPMLPFAKFRTLDDVREEAVAAERAQAVLLGAFAALALLLAAVGLYGLVASSVAERRRELAIRMALGATERQAVIAAAAPGLVLAVIGVSIGLVGARAAAAVLQHLVWGVSVRDPLTFAAAASAALLVATIGTLIPALRIVRLNPVRALKQP